LAHADLIRKEAEKFSTRDQSDIHIVFSAHSIPEKLVTQLGDPYQKEVEQTVDAVIKELGWEGPYHLAWQSKLGPVKWLSPATSETVENLGLNGAKRLLVVPIAFVTDHIETLEELDKELRETAEHAGIEEFHRVPGLNAHPSFIRCLAELALSQKDFWND
jgi:ferrochelatase